MFESDSDGWNEVGGRSMERPYKRDTCRWASSAGTGGGEGEDGDDD